MSAGAFTVYTKAIQNIGDGSFNLPSDTLVMALLTSAYTPAPNTDALWSDVSANEVVTGSGYTAGGVVLSGVTWTISTATNTLTCTAPTWATFSATFKYAVIVRRASASLAGTDKLLSYVDGNSGGGSVVVGGGTLTITPNASGIFNVTHTP
jgi:hypothetical protein